MDFTGQVWKRVWKMILFGLKWGQDMEKQGAHRYPHKEFSGVPPPPDTDREPMRASRILQS